MLLGLIIGSLLVIALAFDMGWTNVVLAVRNNIVFENRNQEYGAFFIRKAYNKTIGLALATTILALGLGVSVPTIIRMFENITMEDPNLNKNTTVDLTEPPPMEEKELPPPPPPPPPPPTIKTIKFVPPEVTEEEEVEPPPTQEEIKDENIGLKDKEGEDGPPPIVDAPVETEDNTIYDQIAIEENASFVGGVEEMLKWIVKNTNYPQLCKENQVSGKVFVDFVVGKDGSITDVTIKKGVNACPAMDAEAKRVISLMPKWLPGRQNGKPARVRFTLPVNFKLQ